MLRTRQLLIFLLSWYTSSTVWLFVTFSRNHGNNEQYAVQRFLSQKEDGHYSQRRGQAPLQTSTTLLGFGLVLQEFSRRTLSRHITSSNVLVVSPDATRVATNLGENNTTKHAIDMDHHLSIGARFLVESAHEGHTIHAISADNNKGSNRSLTLDEWWNSFHRTDSFTSDADLDSAIVYPTVSSVAASASKPSWILLAVFDSPVWLEDNVWESCTTFLSQGTVTYIVLGMHSMKLQNGSYRFGGLKAVACLLQRRYKLQTLSASHYFADPATEKHVMESYGPNALFQSMQEVEDFLKWGADAASYYGDNTGNKIFKAFLFATQGLDLAIPDPQFYLKDAKNSPSLEKYGANIASALKKCPQSLDNTSLILYFDEGALRVEMNASQGAPQTWTFVSPTKHPQQGDIIVWMSGKDADSSEAACVKHRKTGLSKCTSRILESKKEPDSAATNMNKDDDRANILVLLLDPISRSHFQRAMPHTVQALEQLDFIHFSNYTAVGPNSGPNQAGLYSGIPLQKRDGISRDIAGEWLWDRLRKSGYVTLKAEDNCIENSNMVQSLAPNTTHGMALHGLFCFDAFSRPNCIGPDPASSLLLAYGDQFVSTYEHQRTTEDQSLRWASFLHLTDSHEDTKLLAASVDENLSTFLKSMHSRKYFDRTIVVVCSDHGLHYGPSFPTKAGRREATQPILYVRIPSHLQAKIGLEQMKRNAPLYTTPFDVHEMLVELTQTAERDDLLHSRIGRSLTRDLPESRKDCSASSDLIPATYCKLQRDDEAKLATKALHHGHPSMQSFFLDIPPSRRPQLESDPDCGGATADSDGTGLRLCNTS